MYYANSFPVWFSCKICNTSSSCRVHGSSQTWLYAWTMKWVHTSAGIFQSLSNILPQNSLSQIVRRCQRLGLLLSESYRNSLQRREGWCFFGFLTIKLPKVHSSIGPVDAFAWPSSQWPSMWPTSPKAWPTWWRTLWKSLKDSGCRLHRFQKLHGVQNINTNVFCAGGVFWVWPFQILWYLNLPVLGPWSSGPLVLWSIGRSVLCWP